MGIGMTMAIGMGTTMGTMEMKMGIRMNTSLPITHQYSTTQRGYWNRNEMMRKINKQVDRRPIMKAIIRRMNCLSSQFSLQFQQNYSHLADTRLAYHDNAESSSSSRGFRGLAADSAIAIPELRIDTNQATCQSDDRATQDATSHPFQK